MGITEEILENGARLGGVMERMLGNTLNIPHAASDSGSRKILANNKKEQGFCFIHPETPIVGTGYENKFGDKSSSIIQTENPILVLAKISKYSFAPDHHYWLICEDLKTHTLQLYERVSFKYKTEVYGYLNNNSTLDSLTPGMRVPEKTILRKSTGYDEENNKCDGINGLTVYVSKNNLMEDAMEISEDFAQRGSVPIFHEFEVDVAQNIILLNLYGVGDGWKSFPDVGEFVQNGTVLGLRQEKKEEAFFSQSFERLKMLMMSDKKRVCNGRVVDINIICNNPELLEDNPYMTQVKAYYDDSIRLYREITGVLLPLLGQGYKMSYQLEKFYYHAKDVLDNKKFFDEKQINNIRIEFIIIEEKPIEVGDKAADRHGGKGIVSKVTPTHLMPKFNGKYADVIINKSTMYNRENFGQMWELSETYVGDRIVGEISTGQYSAEESVDMILRYLKIVVPEYHAEYLEYVNYVKQYEPYALSWTIETAIREGHIYVVGKPITENMDIFKLEALYDEFPWIKQSYLEMPLEDSNGNIRFVKSRRPFVPGYKYYYRLKQYAEEKLSVTALAATTIKNQNTRSRASKCYSEPFSDTPIKFGQMESDQFVHMGIEHVISNLMLHSLSPRGRKLVEEMYTGDPFNINIKLDRESTNVEVEIMNAYLKTMGLRLRFFKTPKVRPAAVGIEPFMFEQEPTPIIPFYILSDEAKEIYDKEQYLKTLMDHHELLTEAPFYFEPFKWLPNHNYTE